MVRVQIVETVEVFPNVAAKLGENFLEWLDSVGYELVVNPARTTERDHDKPYTVLAQEWVEETSR
jgi:hypothetical protein